MALWKTTVPGKTEIKKKEAPVPQTHFFIERCYIKHQNLKVLQGFFIHYTAILLLATSHCSLLKHSVRAVFLNVFIRIVFIILNNNEREI